jgi:hypothetical protein
MGRIHRIELFENRDSTWRIEFEKQKKYLKGAARAEFSPINSLNPAHPSNPRSL